MSVCCKFIAFVHFSYGIYCFSFANQIIIFKNIPHLLLNISLALNMNMNDCILEAKRIICLDTKYIKGFLHH